MTLPKRTVEISMSLYDVTLTYNQHFCVVLWRYSHVLSTFLCCPMALLSRSVDIPMTFYVVPLTYCRHFYVVLCRYFFHKFPCHHFGIALSYCRHFCVVLVYILFNNLSTFVWVCVCLLPARFFYVVLWNLIFPYLFMNIPFKVFHVYSIPGQYFRLLM